MDDEREGVTPEPEGSDGAPDELSASQAPGAGGSVGPSAPTPADGPTEPTDGPTGITAAGSTGSTAAGSSASTASEPSPGTVAGATGAVRPSGKRRAGTTGTSPARPATAVEGSKRATGRTTARRTTAETPARASFLARITRFLREVAAELRKVIWPTRKELITYTTVVLVFVSFMVAVVAGLDLLFARGVLAVFG